MDLMNEVRNIYEKHCFFGYRRIAAKLNQQGVRVNRKKVLRLMRKMGLQAVYPRKKLSLKGKEHRVYPYLLNKHPPTRANDCWAVDITYIRIKGGYAYLTGVIDWSSRRIMGWSLSPFLEARACIEALKEGLKEATPKIVNSDQGSQFTGTEWIEKLKEEGIKVSMDGKGRCIDNIKIERFWRSLKYEEVYLRSYESIEEARKGIKSYIEFYNRSRPHQSLNYRTPEEVYWERGREEAG